VGVSGDSSNSLVGLARESSSFWLEAFFLCRFNYVADIDTIRSTLQSHVFPNHVSFHLHNFPSIFPVLLFKLFYFSILPYALSGTKRLERSHGMYWAPGWSSLEPLLLFHTCVCRDLTRGPAHTCRRVRPVLVCKPYSHSYQQWLVPGL
jgi:hypothetical protein